jgi:hypothetical protein
MRTFFYLLMTLIVLNSVLAQGGSPDCSESQTFCDTGCSNKIYCPPSSISDGCTTTNFTPSCSGNYYLDAWTSCEEGSCAHCMCCVAVYDGGTLLTACATSTCQDMNPSCCRQCGTVSLTSGHTYSVAVCLKRCPSDDDCFACSHNLNCQACACLRYAITAPCYPCQ